MRRFIVAVMVLFASCGGDDSFNGDYVTLTKHHFFTSENKEVNFYIQATDKNKRGIVDLTNEDFVISENGNSLSLADSGLEVKPPLDIDYKMKLVILIDNGYSAKENLNDVKSAVKDLIDGISNENIEIAIYTFSLNTKMVIDFNSDKSLLKMAVNDIELGENTTDIYGAVVKCTSLWQDTYADNMVEQGVLLVYTDGKENRDNTTIEELKRAIENKRIYTIGYAGGDIDTKQLKMIGTAGFFKARTNPEITDKFSFVRNEIVNYADSFYWLKYISPKVNNMQNTVELTINNSKDYRGENTLEAVFEGFRE